MSLGAAPFEVLQELREGDLSLVQDEMIDIVEMLVLTREKGSTGDGPDASRLAACDDLSCGFALYSHPADESAVGPRQMLVSESSHSGIHEPDGPFIGQHGSHGKKSEGRRRSPSADKA